RIERRDRIEVYDLDGWHLARRGDVKLQERPREQLPGRVVVQLLVERAPDALRHAAVDLSLLDGRVHGPAAIVLNDVLEDAADTGLDVDLDDRRVAAACEGRVRRRVVAAGFEARLFAVAEHGPVARL